MVVLLLSNTAQNAITGNDNSLWGEVLEHLGSIQSGLGSVTDFLLQAFCRSVVFLVQLLVVFRLVRDRPLF